VKSANVQCIKAPCPSLSATQANQASAKLFHELSLAALGFVDQSWLSQRAIEDAAIVSGTLVKDGDVTRLEGSNVFVKLPEGSLCPQFKLAMCPAGQVRAFTRSADRCILPGACVT